MTAPSAYHFDLSSLTAAINSLHNQPGIISPELREMMNRLYPDPQGASAITASQLVIMLLAIVSRVEGDRKKAIVQVPRENWEQLRHSMGITPTEQIREVLSFDPSRVILEINPTTR